MNNMYAVVLFLVVITSTSSKLCFSLNNPGDQEIIMVVDNERTFHDAGMGISKANPVQIGKFILEDGKVVTLAWQAPVSNCIYPDQPCGLLHPCCEGLGCTGWFNGKCVPYEVCAKKGQPCALLAQCCWPNKCSGTTMGSTCL